MTHPGVGVVVAVRVGHNLQEDVHLVEDGGESGVTPVLGHNLLGENGKGTTFSAAGLRPGAAETEKTTIKAPFWRTRCHWPE